MAKKLLVIEDKDAERLAIARLLEGAGYYVAVARDGEKAGDVIAGERPDLILLDMIIPVHDGWEFLEDRRQRGRFADIPVLMVTGLSIASERWAQDLGAQGLVKKPINPSALMAAIESILSQTVEGVDF